MEAQNLKKIIAAALTVVISLSVFYLVETGFMKQTSVILTDYSESEDGTEIYFYQDNGGYTLVLKKNEQTGVWEVPK